MQNARLLPIGVLDGFLPLDGGLAAAPYDGASRRTDWASHRAVHRLVRGTVTSPAHHSSCKHYVTTVVISSRLQGARDGDHLPVITNILPSKAFSVTFSPTFSSASWNPEPKLASSFAFTVSPLSL